LLKTSNYKAELFLGCHWFHKAARSLPRLRLLLCNGGGGGCACRLVEATGPTVSSSAWASCGGPNELLAEFTNTHGSAPGVPLSCATAKLVCANTCCDPGGPAT